MRDAQINDLKKQKVKRDPYFILLFSNNGN